jgi:hypothetical protein
LRAPSIQDDPAKSPARPSIALLALLFLIVIPVFLWTQRAYSSNSWAEDLPVYTQAINSWMAGHNPYDGSLAPLFFLYPPAFLLIAGWLSHLVPAHMGPSLYIAFNVTALVALPLVLARYFFRLPWLSPLFALLLFSASPRFTGIQALRTMNVASPLYCLAFVAAIPGLKSNRWRWFYLAVFLAAIVKITFLALLLLPLLAGRRQWLRSVLCGATVVLANLAEKLYWPDLYSSYTVSLRQGTLGSRAFGSGIFGLIADHRYYERGVGLSAYVTAIILAVTMAGLMFWMRYRLERADSAIQDLASNAVWLGLILIAIVLVNPRQMQYDIDISVFAALILCVVALKIQRLSTLLVLAALLFLPSLAVPLVMKNPHFHGVYEVFLSYAGFVLGYWRLMRDTAITPARSPGQISLA